MTPRRLWTPLIALLLLAPLAAAEVQMQDVTYEHGDVELHGVLAQDEAVDEPKGAVLIVHEWWGLNDYAKGRTRQLAELGYVAFAVDMYGAGKVTINADQAGQWAGELYADRSLARGRVVAGLDAFREAAGLEADAPVVAIGYCFGGTTVTELAYTGAPGLVGVASFHGNPKPPAEDDTIRASLMFCHGDADPLVSNESLAELGDALDAKDADWLLIRYAGAKHAFTNPDADKAGMDAVAYQKTADQRSWRHMRAFFDELFAGAEADEPDESD